MEIKKDKLGNNYVVLSDGTEIGVELFWTIYKMKTLIGKKFGRLLVLKEIGRKHNYKNYLCICECGETTTATSQVLNGGKKKSCGCLHVEKSCEVMKKNMKKYNEFILEKNICKIIIDDKNNALVDIEDYEKCSKHKWYKDSNGYICSHINSKVVYLHHFVSDYKKNKKVIDHRDRDKSNNLKYNLFEVEQGTNLFNKNVSNKNKSGITGVRFVQKRKKWEAYINFNKKRIFLGYFDEKIKAVLKRKEAEIYYYGFNPY